MPRYNPPPNWPAPPAGWSPPVGWTPDTSWGPAPDGWQVWLEDYPAQQQPQQYAPQQTYRGPAKNAHGTGYWVLVGWWWEPLAFIGRMLLWIFLWPVGLWRTLRKGRKNREARERRGYS